MSTYWPKHVAKQALILTSYELASGYLPLFTFQSSSIETIIESTIFATILSFYSSGCIVEILVLRGFNLWIEGIPIKFSTRNNILFLQYRQSLLLTSISFGIKMF